MTSWKRNLFFVWLAQFLSIGGFSVGIPFAPFYIQELGITDPDKVKFYSALAVSATAMTLAFSSPVWGILADRYGRKLMMLRANFGATVVLTAMAFSPTAQFFVAMRFVQGVLTGTLSAAMTFVATSAPQEKQGMALGSLSAAVFSGSMVGPMVGGFVADEFGYRIAFLVSAGMLLTSGLLILFQVRESFTRPEKSADRSWRAKVAALGPGLPILVLLMVMSAARTYMRPIMPLYVQQIHGQLAGSAKLTGMLNGVAALGAMLAGISLGRLADRVSPPLIGKLSAVGAGIFMLLMGCFPRFAILFPLAFLLAFAAGGLDPVFQIWLSKVTPESKRGTIFGWAVTAKSVGWSLAPMTSGIVAVQYGIPMVFFTGPVLYIMLIPLIAVVSRKVVRQH